jgi:hypothetical protein
LDERRKIARWRTAGLSVAVIAEKLGRHRSTIFREVRRNMFVDKQIPDLSGYYCVTAHETACERRAKLRKLARFSHVRQSVIERIVQGWSPQQIAGRMRLERHPISVSHETILQVRLFGRRPCHQAVAAFAGASCQAQWFEQFPEGLAWSVFSGYCIGLYEAVHNRPGLPIIVAQKDRKAADPLDKRRHIGLSELLAETGSDRIPNGRTACDRQRRLGGAGCLSPG